MQNVYHHCKITRLGGPKLAVYIIELISFYILYIYSQIRAPQSCDLAVLQQDCKIARLGGAKLAVYIIELI